MVTYNPTKDKVYALLKDQAKSDDIIKAAFHVSIFLTAMQLLWLFWFLYHILRHGVPFYRLMCYCIS